MVESMIIMQSSPRKLSRSPSSCFRLRCNPPRALYLAPTRQQEVPTSATSYMTVTATTGSSRLRLRRNPS